MGGSRGRQRLSGNARVNDTSGAGLRSLFERAHREATGTQRTCPAPSSRHRRPSRIRRRRQAGLRHSSLSTSRIRSSDGNVDELRSVVGDEVSEKNSPGSVDVIEVHLDRDQWCSHRQRCDTGTGFGSSGPKMASDAAGVKPLRSQWAGGPPGWRWDESTLPLREPDRRSTDGPFHCGCLRTTLRSTRPAALPRTTIHPGS